MTAPEIEIYPSQNFGGSRFFELNILHRSRDAQAVFVTPDRVEYPRERVTGFTTEKYNPGQIVDPCAYMSMENAQTFMNVMWGLGIRPTAAVGSTGQLQATEKHLQDMRAIAFSKLSVEAPK